MSVPTPRLTHGSPEKPPDAIDVPTLPAMVAMKVASPRYCGAVVVAAKSASGCPLTVGWPLGALVLGPRDALELQLQLPLELQSQAPQPGAELLPEQPLPRPPNATRGDESTLNGSKSSRRAHPYVPSGRTTTCDGSAPLGRTEGTSLVMPEDSFSPAVVTLLVVRVAVARAS